MRDRSPSVPAVLVTVGLLRAALAFLPATAIWSLDAQRFVAPPVAWTLWAVALLALVPAVARRVAPAFAGPGHALERSPRLVVPLLALGVAVAVFLLDDRTWFTGDFLLRVGVLGSQVPLARIVPQSMPLDLFLHITVPRWLAGHEWIADPASWARVLGALEAFTLVAVLFAAARREGTSGVAAIGFTAVALGGATLTLFAGYGKTAAEMALLTPVVLLLARRVAREGRGAALLGVALAFAVAIHRSALLLVPLVAAAWWVARSRGRAPHGAAAWGLGLVLPLVAIAALGRKLFGLFFSFDLPHHLFGGASGGTSPGAAFTPVALLDRLNVALAYAPFLALLFLRGPRRTGGGEDAGAERTVELAALVPALFLLVLVTPQQGMFRDWDVFVIPGVLLALACARRAAGWIDAGERPAQRVAPVFASALLGGALWLVQGHEPAAGLARVRAFATEAPARGGPLTGKLWEFLGDRSAALRRWDDAADALRHAVVNEPSPRLWQMLSIAESETGHPEAAERALAEAARRDPQAITLWSSWLLLALQRGDDAAAREAEAGLRRLAPGHPLLQRLDAQRAADSSGAGRAVR